MVKLSSLLLPFCGLSVLAVIFFSSSIEAYPFVDQKSLDILFRPDNNTIKAFQSFLRGPIFGIFNGGGPFAKLQRLNNLKNAIANNNASASELPNRPGLIQSLGFGAFLGIGAPASSGPAPSAPQTTTATTTTTTESFDFDAKGDFSSDNDKDEDAEDTSGGIKASLGVNFQIGGGGDVKTTISSDDDDDDDNKNEDSFSARIDAVTPSITKIEDTNLSKVTTTMASRIDSESSEEEQNDNKSSSVSVISIGNRDESSESSSEDTKRDMSILSLTAASESEDKTEKSSIGQRIDDDKDNKEKDADDDDDNDGALSSSDSVISDIFNIPTTRLDDKDNDDESKESSNISIGLKSSQDEINMSTTVSGGYKYEPTSSSSRDGGIIVPTTISSGYKYEIASSSSSRDGGIIVPTTISSGYKYELASSKDDSSAITTKPQGYQYEKATSGSALNFEASISGDKNDKNKASPNSIIHAAKSNVALGGGNLSVRFGISSDSSEDNENEAVQGEGSTTTENPETSQEITTESEKFSISLSGRAFGTRSDDENDDNDEDIAKNEVVDGDNKSTGDDSDSDNEDERRRNIRTNRNRQQLTPPALRGLVINPQEINNLRFLRRFVSARR